MTYWFKILKDSKTLSIIIILTFLITLMGILSPIFIIHIFNRYISFGLQGTLIFLILGALSCAVFEFLFRNIRSNIFNKILFKPIKSLKMDLTKKFFDYENVNSSINLIDALDFKNSIFQFLSPRNQSNIFDSLFIFIILVVLFFLNATLACLFLFIVLLHSFLQHRIYESKNRLITENKFQLNDQLIVKEIGNNRELLKTTNANLYTLFFVEKYTEKKINLDSAISTLDSKQNSLNNFFMLLSSILVIGIGSIFVVHGDLTIGSLIGFNIFASRVMAIFSGAQSSLYNLNKTNEYFERYIKNFDGLVIRSKGMRLDKAQGHIQIKNLDFSYANDTNFIFKNLDINIPSAEINVISGNNGSGKTTLAKLLLGLYQPDSGEILLDKTNIQKLSILWYREQIAYIPQSPEICNSSLSDNILLGNKNLNDKEISRLIQSVGIDYEIKNTSLTLDQNINFDLSKGIAKKIHIARALAQNPKIFIFDDPFLFLDKSGVQMLFKLINALQRANKTIICFTESDIFKNTKHNKVSINR